MKSSQPIRTLALNKAGGTCSKPNITFQRGKGQFFKSQGICSANKQTGCKKEICGWSTPEKKPQTAWSFPIGIQDGLRLNHLEVEMDNIVVVEVLHPAADLTHEEATIGLGQVEILIGHPLKQLAPVQVLHDQDHLYLYLYLYLHLYLCLYLYCQWLGSPPQGSQRLRWIGLYVGLKTSSAN